MDSGGTNRFHAGGAQIRPKGRRQFAAAPPFCRIIAKNAGTRYAYIKEETNAAKKGAAGRYADK